MNREEGNEGSLKIVALTCSMRYLVIVRENLRPHGA